MSNNNVLHDQKNSLLAYKEKILDNIKYTERSIHEVRAKYKNKCFYDDHADSSDSEDDFASAIDVGPSITQLKLQQAMMKTCLRATQELTGLMVLQSEVDLLVEDPIFEWERPVTEPGTWREVTIECRIDLVPFTMTFFMHTPDRKFGPPSYRGLRVVPVKPAHELELSNSVLHSLKVPSDAVEVLRSYAEGYRSRRTTLARLANKYPNDLFMELHAEGGFVLKCADLLEVSWRLENKGSPVVPFHHIMKFDLEYIEESYVKIITQAHKQLRDPAIQTDERTLQLAKIITTCLEARGTIDPESDLESKTTERDNDIDKRDSESEKRDSEVMAPPKSLPKKGKQKNKENLPNTAQKRSMYDEDGDSGAKKMKSDAPEAKKSIVDDNNTRKNKMKDVVNEGGKKRKIGEVNKFADRNVKSKETHKEDKSGNTKPKIIKESDNNGKTKNLKEVEDKAANTNSKPKNMKESDNNAKTKNVKESDNNAKTKNDKESDNNAKTKNDKESDNNAKTKNDKESDNNAKTKNDKESDNAKTKNVKESENNAKTKNVKESENNAKTKNVKESENNAKTKNVKESENNAKTKNVKESENNAKTKNVKESENNAKTKNVKESENNAKTKHAKEVEDKAANTNSKPKNMKESASTKLDNKNTNAKTKKKVTKEAGDNAAKDNNAKLKTKVLKAPANIDSNVKLKTKKGNEKETGINLEKDDSEKPAEKNTEKVQNKDSAAKKKAVKEPVDTEKVKNKFIKPKVITKEANNLEVVSQNDDKTKNIEKKKLKNDANTKSKENIDANKDAGRPKSIITAKTTNSVKNIETNADEIDKNPDARKLKNVANVKNDDQTNKNAPVKNVNVASTKNDEQAKKFPEKNKEKQPEVANKGSVKTIKEKAVKNDAQTVKKVTEKNATNFRNKDKISQISPAPIKDVPEKVINSNLITKKTNTKNIIKKPIVHKIASHRNSLKPQNPPKVLKAGSPTTITTGNTEKENGGKGSKIPQKTLISIREGSSKKNLLRISPRKIPSKFKTISQDTFKQKMVKTTNIPRLLKKPAPKTS